MKKILLLSITLLTMLMADLTLEGEVLTITGAETTVNPYLEPIDIPAYNSSDPSHLLITVANNKWTSTNLNNTSYKHFYVEAGNYSGSTIILTADGTSGDRRSISLSNGNNIHPASLSEALQANIRIKFNGASYWDIDRMSNINQTTQTDIFWFYGGSTHNVINRLNYKNFYSGIIIAASLSNPNNYNTVQNSYLDSMTYAGRISDNVAIALYNSSISGLRTVGSKFINNEIRNSGDGIQLVVSDSGRVSDVAFDGTIIDSNKIWVEDILYYDDLISKGGALDPKGMYSLSENALDLKAGSADANNPVVVTNNIFWGFRKNADDGDPGTCFNLMYGSDNVVIENNIMFNAQRGIAINKEVTDTYSATNLSIKNNIFYDNVHEIGDVYSNYIYEADNTRLENNSFVDSHGGHGFVFDEGSTLVGDHTWKNNLIINSGSIRNNGGRITAADNHYYDSTTNFSGTGDVHAGAAANSNMGNYVFTYKSFTLNPKSKVLHGVISTEASPHHGVAGSSITQ